MKVFTIRHTDKQRTIQLHATNGCPIELSLQTEDETKRIEGTIEQAAAWLEIGGRQAGGDYGGWVFDGDITITKSFDIPAKALDTKPYTRQKLQQTPDGQHLLFHFERMCHELSLGDDTPFPRPTWLPPAHPMARALVDLTTQLTNIASTVSDVHQWAETHPCTVQCRALDTKHPERVDVVHIELDTPISDIDLDIAFGTPTEFVKPRRMVSRTYRYTKNEHAAGLRLIVRHRRGPNSKCSVVR